MMLLWSCLGVHVVEIFLGAASFFYIEITVSQQKSWFFGSYNLSDVSSLMILGLGSRSCVVDHQLWLCANTGSLQI